MKKPNEKPEHEAQPEHVVFSQLSRATYADGVLDGARTLAKLVEMHFGLGEVPPGLRDRTQHILDELARARAEAIDALVERMRAERRPTAGAACGPLCWGCQQRIGGVHLGPVRCNLPVAGGQCAGLEEHEGDCYANARDRKHR